jgi:opacity protein-like surface antigen
MRFREERMNWMLKQVLIFALFLMLAAGQAAAQVWTPPPDNDWEFSLFGGGGFRGAETYATPVQGGTARAVGLRFADGYVVGARITENLGYWFGAELDYTLSNHPLEFSNLRPDLPALSMDNRVHNLTYSVLIYGRERTSRFRPYGAFGPGVSLFQVFGHGERDAVARGIDLQDSWKFSFSYGGGAKAQMGRNWGLRMDIRDQITGVPGYGLPTTAAVPVAGPEAGFRPDGLLHNWQVSVGFMYTFSVR